MKIEHLIQLLVNEAIAYGSKENLEEYSVGGFLDHLQKKDVSTPSKRILQLPEDKVEQEIIVHVGRLYRYAHFYLKSSMADTLFSTDMDFAFTAILHQYGPMRKMDLIRKMVYEKSSGMEVIKRLIRLGIIEQTDDLEDKRSKLLKLTPLGETEIYLAYQKAGPAAETVSLPMNEHEKNVLFGLLSKLDDFHLAHYLEGETDPNAIIQKTTEQSEE